jgi:cytochrome b involved in lipid metabolism
MVIDIAPYASAHPGGSFLLQYNVGRDISKFFYGGHALDGNGSDPKK